MSRMFAAVLATFATCPAIAWTYDEQPSAPDDPKAIIERLKGNFDETTARMCQGKPDLQTRTIQKKLIEDLDKLLALQQDSAPAGAASSAPRDNRQSTAKKSVRPTPSDARPVVTDANQKPRPEGKESKAAVGEEAWDPRYPSRRRQEIDAFARERLMPRYEELLRAYFRTIAASKNDEGD